MHEPDRSLTTETASQQAIRALADRFVSLAQGARLPTIQELNSEIRVGTGTLQKALTVLRDTDALELRARGHKGTFIESLDHARLWNFAGRQPLSIVLPFIDAPEFRGLSDGITRAFDRLEIRIRVDYRRGAATRLQSVADGENDLCIVSRLAVEHSSDFSKLQEYDLCGVNYYSTGTVVLVSRKDANLNGRIRIGFDENSLDHSLLTQAEFLSNNERHTFVPCSYGHLISALLSGLVDCGIWHRVDLGLAFGLLPLATTQLMHQDTLRLLKNCEMACLVFRKERHDIANIVQLVDTKAITACQRTASRHQEEDLREIEALLENLDRLRKTAP